MKKLTWQQRNKEKVNKAQRVYYKKNREAIIKKAVEYKKKKRQENPEELLIKERAWREKNKEKRREYNRQWKKQNKEYVYKKAREYYHKHRTKQIARRKELYRSNLEENRKKDRYRQQEFRKKNPDSSFIASHKFISKFSSKLKVKLRLYIVKAKKYGCRIGDESLIKNFVEKVLLAKSESCFYCHKLCGKDVPDMPATVEHKIPLSRKGDHDVTNLVLCCKLCNSKKCNKTETEFLKYIEKLKYLGFWDCKVKGKTKHNRSKKYTKIAHRQKYLPIARVNQRMRYFNDQARKYGCKIGNENLIRSFIENVLTSKSAECYYCKKQCGKNIPNLPATTEHKTPLCRKGDHDVLNLVLACIKCNSKKCRRTEAEYSEFLKKLEKFNLLD